MVEPKDLNRNDNISYQMITKSIKEQIKRFFFINPTVRLRVRQIEREINVPLPSAIRYAKELEEEKILKSSLIANVKLYSTDRTSENFLLEKRLFNIRELLKLKTFLIKELNNPTIIVFGSYSRGEDVEKSDIDIFIDNKSKVNLRKFEKDLKRNIQLFQYDDLKEIKNKELANNIINGFVLNGFVEVFK